MRPDLDALRTIADRLAKQDNAGTSDPYFVVYSGNTRLHPRRWRFHAAFLTRAAAEDFVAHQAYNLPRDTFVYVESAHRNREIRALRRDLPALLAYISELEEREETRRMTDAGISVAAQCNTRKSAAQQRISSESPYWTQAYADVCVAVDREIALLEERARLLAALAPFAAARRAWKGVESPSALASDDPDAVICERKMPDGSVVRLTAGDFDRAVAAEGGAA